MLDNVVFFHIGGSLTSTPWQTYPGHVRCPLPTPKHLGYQWGGNYHNPVEKKKQIKTHALECLHFALTEGGQGRFFNRGYIATSALLTLIGASNRAYLYECIAPMVKSANNKKSRQAS